MGVTLRKIIGIAMLAIEAIDFIPPTKMRTLSREKSLALCKAPLTVRDGELSKQKALVVMILLQLL